MRQTSEAERGTTRPFLGTNIDTQRGKRVWDSRYVYF